MVEKRRFSRTPLEAPVAILAKGTREEVPGVAKDISVGGMFIETKSPPPFGTSVVVRGRFAPGADEFKLPGVVRWTRAGGMGVQFGLLGARETHTITEIVRKGGG